MITFGRITILAALVILLTPAAVMAGDPQAGQEKATVCQACHGLDGKSILPEYPNLAGQHESYIVKALKDYRSGLRQNAIMASFVANLTDQDIEDLAAWYSSQDGLEDISIK